MGGIILIVIPEGATNCLGLLPQMVNSTTVVCGSSSPFVVLVVAATHEAVQRIAKPLQSQINAESSPHSVGRR